MSRIDDPTARDRVKSLSNRGQIFLLESNRDCDNVRVAGAFARAERQPETYPDSAARSCSMPLSPITRFMLYANMVRLISVRTFA